MRSLSFLNSILLLLAAGANAVKVGDKIPSHLELHSGFPPNIVNLSKYISGRSVILLGLPGAFTPTWSNVQIPGYIEQQDALKSAGVDEVIVYCVNDGAVMSAWATDQGVEDGGLLSFMADPYSIVTGALDMSLTHTGPQSVGLINRCKRFALYIVDGEVKAVRLSEKEDDPAGDDFPELTLAGAMLQVISGNSGKEEL